MAMGWMAVVLLPLLGAAAFFVLYNNESFDQAVVVAAAGALFVDVLGLVLAIWKVVLGQSPRTFEPVTGSPSTDLVPPTG